MIKIIPQTMIHVFGGIKNREIKRNKDPNNGKPEIHLYELFECPRSR